MQTIKALSDSELLQQTRLLVSSERELTTELLWHLREVDRRRLYAEQGFSSLFDYVRRGLGYCEGSSDRRISAMRLLRDLPEIEPALKSGALSLSNASSLQHFFKREEKTKEVPYSETEKKQLVDQVSGKSRRDCDAILAGLAPEPMKPETSRPISATQTEIRFTANQELMLKFEKLKERLSHQNPNPSYSELFDMLADLALRKLDLEKSPRRKTEQGKLPLVPTPPAECAPTQERSRYIPQAAKRAILTRDQGQCTYMNAKTGVRCNSKHLIEIHHVLDFSLGGGHTLENLTLRCRTHNLHAAIQTQGSQIMNHYLRE